MTPVAIRAIGVCAAGLSGWSAARPILAGLKMYAGGEVPRLAAALLPATERRRANTTSRWALEAAADAVRELPSADLAALPTVFASADGDGEVLTSVLHDLTQGRVALSPTTFHNSVFNAPAGYWSIGAHSPAASTTICGGPFTLAAGLIEAATQATLGGTSVLLVAYDLPFPVASPISTPVRYPFACALLIAPVRQGNRDLGALASLQIVAERGADGFATLEASLRERFGGNPAAAALPLLAAIARAAPATIALPYLDGDWLSMRWSP